MNILFYCSEYPPYRTGGIGRVTKIVAEELVSIGHNVHVIGYYSEMNNNFEKSEENGVKIFRYKMNTIIDSRPCLFRIIRAIGLSRSIAQKQVDFIEETIQEHINQYNIDVLELTDFYPVVLLSRNLKFRKFTIPTVLRVHGSSSFVSALSGKSRDYYIKNDSSHFSRCDYISAVSKYSLQYIVNNYDIPQNLNMSVVYNPIDDEYIKKVDDVKYKILFVGKLIEMKGCFAVAKAFNIIANDIPEAELVFVGSGDPKSVKRIINEEYLSRVKFYGYCNREKLTKLIDQCSIACIPSYFENFSMVVLEIMSRGKTLIFTDRTSGKEIIKDGYNGYTVNPENEYIISERLRVLLNNTELRQSMAINAYRTINEKFRVSVIIKQLVSIYESLLEK